jgi:hypothetical protein
MLLAGNFFAAPVMACRILSPLLLAGLSALHWLTGNSLCLLM